MQPTAAPPALRRIDDLPGPRGWPLLGNLPQASVARIHRDVEAWSRMHGPQRTCRDNRRSAYRDVEAWSRMHGPLFRIMPGPTTVLVVADNETVLAVLRDRPDVFGRSSRLRRIGVETGGLPGLFSAEGQAWHDRRRMVMASVAPGHVGAFFAFLLGVTQRLRARWRKAAAAGAPIDLQSDLKRFAVDAIAGLAFGTEIDSLAGGDDPIHRHLDVILAATFRRVMSAVPYWRWIRLPADRQVDRSMAALQAAIAGFIARARERLQADPARRENPRNLLEAMIAAADGSASGLDDRDVAGNVATMLFAGEDTTAKSLAWLIHLLQRHPEALARAREEVRRLVADLDACTPDALNRLDHLGACIAEAMRLKPVAPFLVLEARRDSAVAGVRVPAGTLLWCVLRRDSVDERHVLRAALFDPQRWLGGDADRRIVLPFGAGPRICPGRCLALLEMKLAMAMLPGGFEIESVIAPGGGEAREAMEFTMNPVGLQMRPRVAVSFQCFVASDITVLGSPGIVDSLTDCNRNETRSGRRPMYTALPCRAPNADGPASGAVVVQQRRLVRRRR